MQPVVLVSLDGIAPRFVTPDRMPHLTGLARSGAGCFAARTIDPPWTRPVHASMLRGVDARAHGLIDNSMAPLAPAAAPTVLAVAAAAGLTTASITNWRQMDSLIEADAVRKRIFIDGGYDPSEDDLMVDLLASIWRAGPPDLTFAYLCRTDLVGHEHGWGSDEYVVALTDVDRSLGRLLDVIGSDTAVVATTDHGGIGTNHASTDRDVMEIFVAGRSDRIEPGSMWSTASTLDIAPTVADLAAIEPHPDWQGASLLGHERSAADELVALLAECERHDYGERVSMLAHSLQTADRAIELDVDDDLALAALLHDIGHVIADRQGDAGDYGAPDHAAIGARFLRPWLPMAITEPIRLHVDAKRHLVAADPDYPLSAASQATLELQGGAFDAEASAAFAAEVHAERAMQLRRCDDDGKVTGATASTLDDWRPRLASALATPAFDPAWARDACRCPACRDTTSGQHLLDVGDLLGWSVLGTTRRTDGREIDLARGDERHRAIVPDRVGDEGRDPIELWGAEHRPTPRSASDVGEVCTDVMRRGLALVAGVPPEEGEVLRFAETVGFVRETNYGRLFDVRAKPDASNLADTPLGLPLHTDNPYRSPVPTVQVLHCLRPAAAGGATILADGFAAAAALRRRDPDSFAVLASTPVRFRFASDDVELLAERTIIELDADDEVVTVAVNNRSLDTPIDSRFATALAAFRALLDSDAIELTLDAGQAIVFDNRRVLHARTGFDATDGRHLQGCYVDIDAVASAARRSS